MRHLSPLLTIVTLLCLAPAASPAQTPFFVDSSTTRAVVVGISDYQEITDLRYAHKDAQAFASFLLSKAGGSLPEENVRLLTNEQATQGQIVKDLYWLLKISQEGDKAVIFFSGHGDVDKELPDQPGFLLAYDSPQSVYFGGGALEINLIERVLAGLTRKGVEVILITDACRSGNLAGNNIQGADLTGAQITNGILTKTTSEVKVLSCEPSEFSYEDVRWGGGRGVFSFFLVNGLLGMADQDGNQKITVRELRRYLEDMVPVEAPRSQNPVLQTTDQQLVLAEIVPELLDSLKAQQFDYDSSSGLVAARGSSPEESLSSEAAELMDEAQQALNNYLKVSASELKDRYLGSDKYAAYAEDLGKAAEILGEDHYLYRNLIAKKLYFEGLSIRLEDETEDANIARALEKQMEALEYENRAAYIYNEIGLLYGNMYGDNGTRDFAPQRIEYFSKAIDWAPTWGIPYANLANEYLDLDSLQRSAEYLLEAVRLSPWLSSLHYGTKELIGRMIDENRAEEAEKLYLDLAGQFGEESWNWPPAYFFFNHSQYVNLDSLYRQVVGSYPHLTPAYLEWGDYQLQFGKFDEGKDILVQGLKTASAGELERYLDGVKTAYQLATLGTDQTDAIVGFLQEAIHIHPEYVPFFVALGEQYVYNGHFEEAEKLFDQALSDFPNNASLFQEVGFFYLKNFEAEKAERVFEQALDNHPDKLHLRLNIGDMYLENGLVNKADDIFEATIRQFPEDPATYREIAGFYMERGLQKQADRVFEAGHDQFPKDGALYYLQANFHYQIGNLNKAQRICERVTQKRDVTGQADLHYLLATIYAQEEDAEDAVSSLKTALDKGLPYSRRKMLADTRWDKIRETESFQAFAAEYFPEQQP